MASDPIEHVLVVMFENRSFDHMVGSLSKIHPSLDGVDLNRLRSNRDSVEPGAARYAQAPVATRLDLDPGHEVDDVQRQLTADGECGGFVIAFATDYPKSTAGERQEVMNYFPVGAVPALHSLAQAFTVCDRWFSSVPGPTWTNRFFVHSGTSLGRVQMPQPPLDLHWHFYDQTTLYDRLNEAKKDWRIYYGDVPQSLILAHQWTPRNAARYHPMSRFFDDCAGDAGHFPAYTFIEPTYFGTGQNDQHPATDVHAGDTLLADIYGALRANQALWQSSLLIVLYDEHGGFYDHVLPGPATPPDTHQDEYTFDQFGVRVPAVLVSPWIQPGVCHTMCDHTSILRYLSDKWSLGPLGQRTSHAASFAEVVGSRLRADTPVSVTSRTPRPLARLAPQRALTEYQRSLIALSEALESKTSEPPDHKVARMALLLDGPSSQADVARQRVERFLVQRREMAGAPTPVTRSKGKTKVRPRTKRSSKKRR